MSMASRDLFDDSTMTFGEHLEVLRVHLFKAILGFTVCILVTLFYGNRIIEVIREPIDDALKEYGQDLAVQDDVKTDVDWWPWLKEQFGFDASPDEDATTDDEFVEPEPGRISVELDGFSLVSQLHSAAPETFPAPPDTLKEKPLKLELRSHSFGTWDSTTLQMQRPVTLNVQEAFMTYLKVSLIAGFVLSSPWIFYQLWLFVAAGLYKHERKFVYAYGLLSLFLFLAGVVFCFKAVFPFVLKFLLSFNLMLGLTPQIRLSEWVSFAVMLPLMFGISFQLPLVMRFLSAISIFNVTIYREKRRLAILVIAFLSMVLTPADPMSMLLMMFPLVLLYEFGILLCSWAPAQNPFDAEPV
ncbi:MAG: twin-arginine translocase subunit TatC [Planctomycetaceae bacterium]|nr:twin-arginine translocase subunit TatC [Planctomycetaceae bacterium]